MVIDGICFGITVVTVINDDNKIRKKEQYIDSVGKFLEVHELINYADLH